MEEPISKEQLRTRTAELDEAALALARDIGNRRGEAEALAALAEVAVAASVAGGAIVAASSVGSSRSAI